VTVRFVFREVLQVFSGLVQASDSTRLNAVCFTKNRPFSVNVLTIKMKLKLSLRLIN
jgi:hypothetical protein